MAGVVVGVDVIEAASGGPFAHLMLAVINLLINAVKFTDDGGTISCRVTENGDDAVLEISDSGTGIPRFEQQHLFTRFFRSSTASSGSMTGSPAGRSAHRARPILGGGPWAISATVVAAVPGTRALASRSIAASYGYP